jgi:tetratricopeptide (TPR) repeat protein
MSARNFKRLQKARVDGDWQEVLKCVERLRRSRELTKIGLSDEELVRNRAIALARLGHLDRGLAEYNKILEISKTPDWLMTTHLSSIYDAGLQYEKTFELRMQAISQKPTATAVYIDAALTAVCRLNRAAEARELLSKLGNRKFSSLENGFMHFVTGVILWREKNPAEAKGELEQALQELKPWAEKTPLTRGTLLRIKSYLAVVNDELGASDCAQVLFRETRHYLKTHQEFELLNLLEKFA